MNSSSNSENSMQPPPRRPPAISRPDTAFGATRIGSILTRSITRAAANEESASVGYGSANNSNENFRNDFIPSPQPTTTVLAVGSRNGIGFQTRLTSRLSRSSAVGTAAGEVPAGSRGSFSTTNNNNTTFENNSENRSSATSTTTSTCAIGSFRSGVAVPPCHRTKTAAQSLFICELNGVECTVREAMIFAKFTPEETRNKALKMRVKRYKKKLMKGPP